MPSFTCYHGPDEIASELLTDEEALASVLVLVSRGVDKMSDEEREALSDYLSDYTLHDNQKQSVERFAQFVKSAVGVEAA